MRNLSRDKITSEEWSKTHPMAIKCASDKFYADTANMLMLEISTLYFPDDTPEGLVPELAKALTSYFEDVVSGIGVWKTIRRIYKSIYKTDLPFYDTAHGDYEKDDINIEDLKFLSWVTMSRLGFFEDYIYSPHSYAVTKISEIAFNLFDDLYEEAPQALRLRDVYLRSLKKMNFGDIRSLAISLVMDNPMTANPGLYDNLDDTLEKAEEKLKITTEERKYFIHSMTPIIMMDFGANQDIIPDGKSAFSFLSQMAADMGLADSAKKLSEVVYRPDSDYKILKSTRNEILLRDSEGG